MKLIVADDSVYKFFIEYMHTFESYIPISKSQLSAYRLEDCEEIVAVQRGTWLPESVYKYPLKISIANTEQLCDPSVLSRVLSEIMEVGHKVHNELTIYDYSTINSDLLGRNGLTVVYHPYTLVNSENEFLHSLHSTPKVYDIGFVGALNERRKSVLDELRNAGISVNVVTSFGKERDYELAKCNYILNIHWDSHFTIFESIRCNRWLDAGYKIITETSTDIPKSPLLFQTEYSAMTSYIVQLIHSNREFNKIKDYIVTCIQPRSTHEFVEDDLYSNEKYNALCQDGIMVVSSNTANDFSPSQDYVQIGNKVLLRKNSPRQLEWLKDDDTILFDSSRNPIYRRLIPPPIETVDHVFLISQILRATNSANKTYIEYGVRSGTSIECVANLVSTAYGVDISEYSPRHSNIQFFKMLTDTFSENHLKDIAYHYAFIDADHSSKQVIIDFEYIYKYMQKDGYIFLHDTYPCDAMFLRPDYCNDCYKTPLLIREKYPDIEMLTLPLNPGFTIVHKK